MAGMRDIETNNAENTELPSWYCHSCQETTHTLSDFTCSKCHSGFVEQMEPRSNTSEDRVGSAPSSMQRLFVRSTPYSPGGSRQRVMRRTHIAIHRLQPNSNRESSFQDFMNQLIERVTGDGDNTESGAVNVVFGPAALMMGQIAGNLVVASGGLNRLDNIITMLLNHLDQAGTGPPPASDDQINALPTVDIIQEQVDASLQCNICMEDFILDEKVRSLPCKHIYHGVCIVPWLELHGTCPICRREIESVPATTDLSSTPTSSSV